MRTASCRKSLITSLVLFLVLGASAWAQSQSGQSPQAQLKAMAGPPPPNPAFRPKAPPKPQAGEAVNFTSRRFEVSFQGGAVVGGNLGRPNIGSCAEAVTGGCDVNQNLGHFFGSSVYPGRLGGVRNFQRFGGLRPGNGGVLGLRFGVNINPRWQVEVIWNYARTNTAFTNKRLLDQSVTAFNTSGFGAAPRIVSFEQNFDGKAKGTQNMWLFNVNRNFNAGGRVVPYVGAGIGVAQWFAGPKVVLHSVTDGNAGFSEALFIRTPQSATGVAVDVAAGAKIHVTRHFGFRADFMNVISFPEINNPFSTIDVTGIQGTPGAALPLSGATKQRGRFNQSIFSGGVFWTFGGELKTTQPSAPSGDRESKDDHWELSFTFGGVHGSAFGDQDVTCTEAVPTGCNFTQNLSTNGGNGVFENKIAASLPGFLASGGVKPGNGWMTGIRLGYNFTPHWQAAFIWNYAGTGTAFTNKDALDLAQTAFFSGRNNATPRSFNFNGDNDGSERGNQQQYLFNVHYNLGPQKRIVPYVGGGFGFVRWYNSPSVSLTVDNSGGSGQIADFSKQTDSGLRFAFDLAGGVKFYTSRHMGFRVDFMNVTSFPHFTHTFTSIDTDGSFTGTPGTVVPVSGTLKQSARFNQVSGSGGIFFTF